MDLLTSLMTKEQMSKSLVFSEQITLLLFCSQETSDFAEKKFENNLSFFTFFVSFLKSDVSELLRSL